MTRTVAKAFDPEALPEWAKCHAAVLELCRRSEGFREKVCRAKTEHWRRFLIGMAERCLANMREEG